MTSITGGSAWSTTTTRSSRPAPRGMTSTTGGSLAALSDPDGSRPTGIWRGRLRMVRRNIPAQGPRTRISRGWPADRLAQEANGGMRRFWGSGDVTGTGLIETRRPAPGEHRHHRQQYSQPCCWPLPAPSPGQVGAQACYTPVSDRPPGQTRGNRRTKPGLTPGQVQGAPAAPDGMRFLGSGPRCRRSGKGRA